MQIKGILLTVLLTAVAARELTQKFSAEDILEAGQLAVDDEVPALPERAEESDDVPDVPILSNDNGIARMEAGHYNARPQESDMRRTPIRPTLVSEPSLHSIVEPPRNNNATRYMSLVNNLNNILIRNAFNRTNLATSTVDITAAIFSRNPRGAYPSSSSVDSQPGIVTYFSTGDILVAEEVVTTKSSTTVINKEIDETAKDENLNEDDSSSSFLECCAEHRMQQQQQRQMHLHPSIPFIAEDRSYDASAEPSSFEDLKRKKKKKVKAGKEICEKCKRLKHCRSGRCKQCSKAEEEKQQSSKDRNIKRPKSPEISSESEMSN